MNVEDISPIEPNSDSHDSRDQALKDDLKHGENKQRNKHRSRKKNRSKKHKEKPTAKVEDSGDMAEDSIKENKEFGDERIGEKLKGQGEEGTNINDEGEEAGKSAKKIVGWKKEIEATREFQGSVLEQNVIVNLEVPDDEFENKGGLENTLESYCWDSSSCGANITVVDKKPYVARRLVAKQSTDGARGSRGFASGRHTFRFKFNDKPWGSNCSIGICTANASLHKKGYCHLFGEDEESWAWDIPSGSLLHQGESTQYYVSAIEEKLIYMTLDFNKGHLYFQPKDRDRFLAFKGIPTDQELFPCVSMVYGLAEVKLGLKHSTDDRFKVLKRERQEKSLKEKSTTTPLAAAEKEPQKEELETTNNMEKVGASSASRNDNFSDNPSSESIVKEEKKQHHLDEDAEKTTASNMDSSVTEDLNKNVPVGQTKAISKEGFSENDNTENQDNTFDDNGAENVHPMDKESSKADNESTGNVDGGVAMSQQFTAVQEHKMTDTESGTTDNDQETMNTEGSSIAPRQSEADLKDDNGEMGDQVSSFMSRGQPDGQRQGDPDRENLYKRPSSLSWADTWQDSDLYVVDNGNIIREQIKDRELSDLEEPEDAQYTDISSLIEAQRYSIQLSHGWDITNRGGTIHLYPNIPYICVPMPNFGDRVQGIRGRQGFKTGIHKWRISEVKTFSPNVPLDEMHASSNKLHIGVVSEEQRTFNFGYRLASVGPHVWTCELDTGLVWHGNSKTTDLTLHAGNGSSEDDPPNIDLTRGIDVELNFYKHMLTLTYNGKVIGQIKQIRAKHLFPFVLFNKKAVFPVEIQYLKGPEDYVSESLSQLTKKESLDREDLVNYRGLTRQMSSKTNIVVVENEMLNTYSWGDMSEGLKTKALSGGNVIYFNKDSHQLKMHFVAIAEKPIFGQRHKIDFSSNHIDSCIFGLASKDLDRSALCKKGGIENTEHTVSILGNNIHSWAWDPKTCSLYHAGRYLGRYPSRAIDFQYEKYDRLRLVVDFSTTGYNIASFLALPSTPGRPLDLGIAFVNLPSSVYPCVAIVTGGAKEQIEAGLDYVSGPKGFVTDIVQAKTCNIL